VTLPPLLTSSWLLFAVSVVGRPVLADLRVAFAESQFTLHYQPQLDLRTGEVFGVEALVRWRHPTRGLVAPDQFLPVLEQANLMTSLTQSVLREALSDCSILHRSGFPLRMSVNVSASDLMSEGLADAITKLLNEHDVPPDMLVVEVTENSVMTDRVRSLRTLRRIRAAGVHLSVDDYGTGQASLSYIRDLPITEIKLDRSFLQGFRPTPTTLRSFAQP
jgi:diguanylate cyclase